MKASQTRLVDCHCHMDLFGSPPSIVSKVNASRTEVIAVTNTPSTFWYTRHIGAASRFVRPAVGLHPQLVEARHKELDTMRRLMNATRFIGEIGLDYTSVDDRAMRLQQGVFEQILTECALYGNKVLSVHSRRASRDVISMIGPNFPASIILHWFSGPLEDLARAMRYGMYLSVNTTVTESRKAQRIIGSADPSLVLTETDGPFVRVGAIPAVPSDVLRVVEFLSAVWDCDLEEARSRVYSNYLRATGCADVIIR